MQVEPYLSFNGRCEEALKFYEGAIGARIEAIMRFSESPEPMPPGMIPPGAENKVMHSVFSIGQSKLMASDGNCGGQTSFAGISLTLNAPDDETAEKLFNALADGGQIQMPLSKTFWTSRFGMVTDRFGVPWMVNTFQ